MADETIISELDKRLIVCPLCEKLGYGQNYRCTERPNKGHIECRPVSGTDAFADAHKKVLNSPKGEPVEVMDSRGETITLRGLGFEDEQALRFSMKAGLKAREAFVERVNSGDIKAPRKNWDKTYGPEKTVTWEDPKTGETMSFQIGGGKPLDDLKNEFSTLYGTKTSTKKGDSDEPIADDDAFAADLDAEMDADDEKEMRSRRREETSREGKSAVQEEDVREFADDIEGEGAFEEEPSYAAVETADTDTAMMDDDAFEEDSPRRSTLGSSAKETTHEHSMTIQAPKGEIVVRANAFRFQDPEGTEHTMYKVKHPDTERIVWLEEGMNQIDGATIELKVRS